MRSIAIPSTQIELENKAATAESRKEKSPKR
jgi:hypothetical protein